MQLISGGETMPAESYSDSDDGYYGYCSFLSFNN